MKNVARCGLLTVLAAMPSEFAVSLSFSQIPKAAVFVARECELTAIHRLLYGHDERSIAVLHGLGGIGKTLLAVAYLRRHKRQYSAIFWIDASTYDSILLGFSSVARQILRQHPSAALLASVDQQRPPSSILDAVAGRVGEPGRGCNAHRSPRSHFPCAYPLTRPS